MALDFTRQPADNAISINRTDDEKIFIHHEGDEPLILSPFNAARLLAGLSMVLNLPLTKASMKAIKM